MCRSERVDWQLTRPSIVFGNAATSLMTRNANRFVRSFNFVSCHLSQSAILKICDFQSLLDRALPQRVIAKDERGHRFYDGHRSRENTRIVAATDGKLGRWFELVTVFCWSAMVAGGLNGTRK